MTFQIFIQLKINTVFLVLKLIPYLFINNLSSFAAYICFPQLYKIHFLKALDTISDYLGVGLLFIVSMQGQWANPCFIPVIPSYYRYPVVTVSFYVQLS